MNDIESKSPFSEHETVFAITSYEDLLACSSKLEGLSEDIANVKRKLDSIYNNLKAGYASAKATEITTKMEEFTGQVDIVVKNVSYIKDAITGYENRIQTTDEA